MSAWGWLAVAASVLAVVLFTGATLLGRGDYLPSWRGARLFRLSRLAARFWASWLGAHIRRLGASKARRQRLDAAQREANARRLAETMGNMKGAFMKLGQMVSFVSDDVPEEYRVMLQSLQTQAPAMDFTVIRDVIESELERPLERAFARFDEEPLAAASIGQVHRAQLPSGDEVVVKVQYPGVDRAIRSDLENADVLTRAIGLMYPRFDPKPVVAELRARISEELDYRREAKNQAAFAELYRDHPFIRVPGVFADHSTHKIITSEYVSGRTFDDIVATDESERQRWGEILFRFVFGSIVRFRVFNGDPHPGNYLFDPAGRMVFLDFGCTKYFPREMHHNWRSLITAHLRGDRDRFRQLLVSLSFVADDSDLSAEDLYDYFSYFYESFRFDRKFQFTREYNKKSFRMVLRPDGPFEGFHKELNMPPDFVFVNRIHWGVISILSTLGAAGNWHRIQREFLFGEAPSTEMGREIARWRSRWLEQRGWSEGDIYLTADGPVSDDSGPSMALSA
ncbi:MAG: AarF/ABC1/UbiB kinase family protein [Proteobacteria bacterium]|nr:AarF/ABC1/UbiB kinase family protein [Pseudomonadota bacterium]